MGHTRRGLTSSLFTVIRCTVINMQRRRRREEKAAVRVKGERGRSRFTVTFSPILPKQQQPAVVVGGFFFGRHFMFLNGCHVYLVEKSSFYLEEHIRQMSLLLRLANFIFLFLFCGNGSACGGGKTNKNGASEQEGLFPFCLRHGNTARKNKKVANVPGVIFLYSFFRGKET